MRTTGIIIVAAMAGVAGCAGESAGPTPAPRVAAEPASPAVSPTAIVQRFRDVLRGEQVNNALFMLDEVDYGSPSAEQLRARMRRLAGEMAKNAYDFQPVDEQVQGDAAVVAAREVQSRDGKSSAGQYIGFFLVRRDGAWKISPEPADYRRFRSLTKAQMAAFEDLDRWFQIRKAELKMEDRGR